MKKIIARIMAVVLTAIFVFGTTSVIAAPSAVRVNKDYRNMDIINRQGVKVNKPTAQFAANRIVNGEVADMVISYDGYDCNTEIPTLVCYVGDTLTFTDMSRENNGGTIVQWDWQRFGALGEKNDIYTRNIVNEDTYTLTEPGESSFYLSVRSDTKVKTGICDPWSENGNHQVIGKNKWFPNGAYWYFTAIRVVVKPVREAKVYVRYKNMQTQQIFYEETISAGKILGDNQTVDTSFNIIDWDGYEFSEWKVQLMDGTVQYSGTNRDVAITLAGWLPEKYLYVEFYPYADTSVQVRYWDKVENTIIKIDILEGEPIVRDMQSKISAEIKTPDGYRTTGWNVQLMDGTIQYEGTSNIADVILDGNHPKKNVNVKCYPINNKKVTVNYINTDTGEVLKTTVVKPHQEEATSLTTEIELENITGYIREDWTLKTDDGVVENRGVEVPVSVTLTNEEPHKFLDVNCFYIGDEDDEHDPYIPPTVTVKPNGICDGVIEWSETDSHRVLVGRTSDGRAIYRWCEHVFKYKSVLDAVSRTTPSTLKSGYGFGVDVTCTMNTTMVSNAGCGKWGNNRRPTATVKKPTKATIFVPWDMSNRLGMQGRSISMVANGNLKFTLPESPVSETGARKIYTPVELAGTKEEPQLHEFEIYISGGGIGSVEFCKGIYGTITINGDMYEDDVRPDRALL